MVDVVRCGRRRAVNKWQRRNGGINVGRVEVLWCLENTKLRVQYFSDTEVQEDEVYVQRGEKKQRLLLFTSVGRRLPRRRRHRHIAGRKATFFEFYSLLSLLTIRRLLHHHGVYAEMNARVLLLLL